MTGRFVWAEEHTTTFAMKELGELRGMLDGADPAKVRKVADSWSWIHKVLVASEGGGLKQEFDKAVEEVLEHWSGEAAEGFRKRANKISKKIEEAAVRAKAVESPMRNVATVLQSGIDNMKEIKDPNAAERGADKAGNVAVSVLTLGQKGGRDDSGAKADIAAGVPTQDVLRKHATELSEGKERALKAAMVLEYVSGGYRTYAKSMKVKDRQFNDPNFDAKDYDGGAPAVVPFSGGGVGQKGVKAASMPTGLDGAGLATQAAPTSPRPDGITGGIGTGGQPGSQVGTGLNTAGPGVGTGGGVNVGNLGAPSAGGGPTSAASGGGIGAPGIVGTAGGGTRGTGAGGRVAGGGGRMGAPGMGGGAGARQGGNNKKGGSGRGALAKQRGGVVGAAGKGAARAQGGSGLHRSRGGKQAGATGQKGKGMMAGAPGSRGGAGKDDKERRERPDYLVEDEETWVTKKNVTPRVVD